VPYTGAGTVVNAHVFYAGAGLLAAAVAAM
jgi:hypothetical protein